jgi:opacity protein-like surface antigen
MKSTFKYLSILLIVFNIANSQTISIGLGSGINMIQGNNFYTQDFDRIGLYTKKNGTQTNFAGLAQKNEYEYAINSKIRFSNYPISLIAQVHYIPMRGKENVEMWDLYSYQSHYENVTTINDIWSYRIGVRYDVKFNDFYSFCNASYLMNSWKDAKLQFDYNERITTLPQYRNGMRYGYNSGIGIGYEISSVFEIEMEGSYSFMNEYNVRDGEVKMNTVNILFTTYYAVIP